MLTIGNKMEEEGWEVVTPKKQPQAAAASIRKPAAGPMPPRPGRDKRKKPAKHSPRSSEATAAKTTKTAEQAPTRNEEPVLPSSDLSESAVAEVAQGLEALTIEPSPAKPKAWTPGAKINLQASQDPSAALISISSVPVVDFVAVCRSFRLPVALSTSSSSSSSSHSIRGLLNSSCACFRNCVLQALLALPPMLSLLDHLLQQHTDTDRDLAAFPAWRELLAFYQVYGSAGRGALSADLYLATTFAAFQRTVDTSEGAQSQGSGRAKRRGSQQDAMEFLTFLLDQLHEELLLTTSSEVQADAEAEDKEVPVTPLSLADDEDDGERGWQTVKPKDRKRDYKVEVTGSSRTAVHAGTAVGLLFHGCLRSEVLYRIKRVCSVTFQRVHALTLHLPEGAEDAELTDALRTYFAVEAVDEHTQKLVKVQGLPEVLILQIARFSFNYSSMQPVKLHRGVRYPAALDLRPYLADPSAEADASYRLQAVILHHGKKATGGHYSTYSLHQQQGWSHLNDAKVNAISDAAALSAHSLVYMLLYCRIHTPLIGEGRDSSMQT